ncbi:hypothetical protein JHK85_007149 [Glycine max]|nr:hypothetical protein JHK85_007149 [Glycine max]KAG5071745.1 hypothetical protein JHK86_006956 [Glycine max]
MAIGKMYNLRSIIHHKKIEDDNARVVVEEAVERCSKDVPHKKVEPELDPLEHLLMIASQNKNPIQLPWDPNVLSRPSSMPFYIHQKHLLEMWCSIRRGKHEIHVVSISWTIIATQNTSMGSM